MTNDQGGARLGALRFAVRPARPLSVFAGLLALAAMFLARPLLDGTSPYRGDVPVQFYPWRVFALECLRDGTLPLWNPYSRCGSPLLANMQSAVFYPPELALAWLDPAHLFTASLLLHLAAAGLACYALARRLRISAAGGLLAALGTTYGGYVATHIVAGNHLTVLGTLWLAPLLWASHRVVRAAGTTPPRAPAAALLLALVAGCQILCGHPQMTFYNGLFSAGAALAWAATGGRFGRCMGWWAAGMALGGLLAALQWVPTLAYAAQTVRGGGLDFAGATEFSLAPSHWITFLAPDFFGSDAAGTYWGNWYDRAHGFVGLAPLGLALVAVGKRGRETDVRILAALAAVSLLLALGRHNPLYRLVFELPGFSLFRSPVKFLAGFVVAVPLLGGMGLDWFRARAPRPSWGWLAAAAAAVAVAALARGLSPQWAQALWPVAVGERVAAGTNPWETILPALGRAALVAAALAVVWRLRTRPRTAAALLLAVTAIELLAFARPHVESIDLRDVNRPSVEVRALAAGESYRIATHSTMPSHEAAAVWGLFNASGYDPMTLDCYAAAVNRAHGRADTAFQDNWTLDCVDHPLADLLSVRYILARAPLPAARWQYAGRGALCNVYQNPHALPRARLVTSWEAVSREEALRRTGDATYRPREAPAPVEGLASGATTVQPRTIAPAEAALETRANSVTLRLSPSHPGGLLVLADTFAPGWTAAVDGSPRQVYCAYGCLRAVRVEAGAREIVFRYRPVAWRVGCWTSLAGLLCAVGLAILAASGRRKAEYVRNGWPESRASAPEGNVVS